jgi:hypothetical protein
MVGFNLVSKYQARVEATSTLAYYGTELMIVVHVLLYRPQGPFLQPFIFFVI